MADFKLKNKMAVSHVEKIVVNMGIGEGTQDIKMLEKSVEELGNITGQKPIIRRAKKAIANFKVRQGQAVGAKVTLRRAMMYEFMDRLLNISLPRIRDFRGVSRDSFSRFFWSTSHTASTCTSSRLSMMRWCPPIIRPIPIMPMLIRQGLC
ncbi:MAG: 50S ribosomal protein L5 [Candidatus Omnitrophica bacterium]|nr:50S ribosomal protein L5 [Candidatus Omnitrophota bacterium]